MSIEAKQECIKGHLYERAPNTKEYRCVYCNKIGTDLEAESTITVSHSLTCPNCGSTDWTVNPTIKSQGSCFGTQCNKCKYHNTFWYPQGSVVEANQIVERLTRIEEKLDKLLSKLEISI
jgi:DNA-directed RNA polymerase subunit RPC12/RpoP